MGSLVPFTGSCKGHLKALFLGGGSFQDGSDALGALGLYSRAPSIKGSVLSRGEGFRL